jgi:hypothetical protein
MQARQIKIKFFYCHIDNNPLSIRKQYIYLQPVKTKQLYLYQVQIGLLTITLGNGVSASFLKKQ